MSLIIATTSPAFGVAPEAAKQIEARNWEVHSLLTPGLTGPELLQDTLRRMDEFADKMDVLSVGLAPVSEEFLCKASHLKALVKLSDQIFDVMKKHHGLGNREKVLMETIAILHDCGKYISIAEASDCSYTIIMSSEILGLTHKEREIIATTVALNRKPLDSYEKFSDKFTQEEYIVIVKLLAILKVANALDRSHKQKFKNVSMVIKDSELNISMESKLSIALEKGLFAKN